MHSSPPGPAECCRQAREPHIILLTHCCLFKRDTQVMSTNCLCSVGYKSLHYSVGCAGCWRCWMVTAKAKTRMLLQKVILIDKAPCGLACGLLSPPIVCLLWNTRLLRQKPWTTQTERERQWNQWLSHTRPSYVLPNHLKGLPWHSLHLPPLS